MKYAFRVLNLILVEADSEEKAWLALPEVAQNSIPDFTFARSSEDDVSTNFAYVILRESGIYASVLPKAYTTKEDAELAIRNLNTSTREYVIQRIELP